MAQVDADDPTGVRAAAAHAAKAAQTAWRTRGRERPNRPAHVAWPRHRHAHLQKDPYVFLYSTQDPEHYLYESHIS